LHDRALFRFWKQKLPAAAGLSTSCGIAVEIDDKTGLAVRVAALSDRSTP
jgi:calcineurin-like phosphoesterase